jgi:hypothetical protein
MANSGDVQYRMKCAVCGKPFSVDTISSKVPKHPKAGQPLHPDILYVACAGSGLGGIVAGTKIKRFDDPA